MSKQLIITGGTVVCPDTGVQEPKEILVEGATIKAVDKPGSFSANSEAQRVDASSCYVTPGLIDIHVHLREPGFEWKETIQSGAASAVKGGFTEVSCMPNTNPVNDCGQVTEFILEQAKKAGLAKVGPIGAISKGLEGKEMAPLVELKEAGCVAFSDDGYPVWNSALMRRALEYAKSFDGVLTVHEEDKALSQGFSMNESELSVKMGLVGMPEAAENVMIARDIELARLTGARVHFCHVSTARGVTLIRRAKEDGIAVTAETTPHYLTLTEDRVSEFETNAKMSMPLRKEEDIEALLDGLRDGTIDCIASDHAPHDLESKQVEFDKASFGIIGLESTLPIVMSLVRDGKLELFRAIESLTTKARSSLNMKVQGLKPGDPADITVIDPEKREVFSKESIVSKSKNSPYLGHEFQGLARNTIVDGKVVYSRE